MTTAAEDRPTQRPLEDEMDRCFMEARRLLFSDAVDNDTARDAIRRLWFMDHKEPGKPILLIINSPGGSVDAGLAIWDQVKMLRSPVTTLVTGLAASMGSILSLCASPGKRFATPNARIMIHQPRIGGVIQGQATDLEIQAKEILKTRRLLVEFYVQATGKSAEVIDRAIDRDTWMSAQEAMEYGLLDGIISSHTELTQLTQG